MRIYSEGDTLRVSELKELAAANSSDIRDGIRAALKEQEKNIEMDLSDTDFLDSCGLGCLVALHKTAAARGGSLRLLRPTPKVQQLLQLTRMDRVFEVEKG